MWPVSVWQTLADRLWSSSSNRRCELPRTPSREGDAEELPAARGGYVGPAAG